MSISSLSGAARITSTSADTAAGSENSVRQSTSTAGAGMTSTSSDGSTDVYKAPTPPRFPWLSRLSEQLEAASDRKPTFPSAPVIGDNVDQSA